MPPSTYGVRQVEALAWLHQTPQGEAIAKAEAYLKSTSFKPNPMLKKRGNWSFVSWNSPCFKLSPMRLGVEGFAQIRLMRFMPLCSYGHFCPKIKYKCVSVCKTQVHLCKCPFLCNLYLCVSALLCNLYNFF